MDHQQHQQQMNSGLTRYRSAPSSYFADLMNFTGYGSVGEDSDQFLKASSPDSDRFFSRFMSSCGAEESNSTNLCEIGRNPLVNEPIQSQFMAPIKHEPDVINPQQQQQGVYTSLSQLDHKPFLPKLGVEMGGGSNSNLIRHSSSPAGLFAQINVDNGYGVMRGLGSFGAGSVANAEASFSSASRVRNQMDFPAGAPSSSGIMPRASEIVGCTESGSLGKSRRNDASYVTGGLPTTSWDDSALLSDNFLKGLAENERKTFSNLNSLENQSGEGGTQTPTVLAHHLSLPTSSAMEKLLQFQDSVPLRIRAKRGYATHPRSIAERVRRTRISERMRKLQELVPNMEKQTNTADMLDLAVDYIKGLQQQVQTLSDNRAKCSCSNNQKK